MFKLMNKARNKKGFTLVELIIVIAIIGILAGITAPRLASFNEKAREATDEANARVIASIIAIQAADGALDDNGATPIAVAGSAIEDLLPEGTVPSIVSDAYDGDGTYVFYYDNNATDGIVVYAGTTGSEDAITIYPQ